MPSSELDAFLGSPADAVARRLIGWTLLYTKDGITRGGVIVETEAYAAHDPASHSYRGQTARNAAMYGPPGTLYVYFIYGMHYCLNVVTGGSDGQAVLLRALEPTVGLKYMQARRPKASLRMLCNGPAKLVEALGVSPVVNGQYILDAGFALLPPQAPPEVTVGPRVGITKAAGTDWNYRLAGSSFVSQPSQASFSSRSRR
jgi:DNA-3-methyladenine glycosylase